MSAGCGARVPFLLITALIGLLTAACAPVPAAVGPTPGPATPASAPASGPVSAPTSPPTSDPASGPDPAGPGPTSVDRPVVVLDPGHNGGNGAAPEQIGRLVPDGRGGRKACNTTGTATDAGYPEHAFTWDVALRVQELLAARDVEVVLTRPDDDGVGPCVDERGSAGQRAGADAVVSIHADGSAPGNSGFHVAYSDPPVNAVQAGPALDLATDVRDALRAGGYPDSDYIGRAGLSPRPDLAGLNHAEVPAVLVECGNMRNAAEAERLSSAAGRQSYAEAITAGIVAFLDR